ncbi:biogenesis of lysosome-related organelles complex 1 subunit 2-like [Dreissena polymorpha]|uniref:Biogenesis of lysosome-related organelles complex 1 subunit 2 n=1 Tax=Dreissena polymorpha TaxID=45954 RepID=A0A9D4LVY4_DREPO|nr:biogenesis of lysosome-related organelles complex 1 subunit 2-like [Dreissena polymorpha]KAH3863831.1 hypothetical protein DPMN_026832 [Dreissena polymorpha]
MADQGGEVDTNQILERPPQKQSDAKNEPASDIVDLCSEAFKKTAEYIMEELSGTVEDYKLLETMNKVTVSKYAEMKGSAHDIGCALQELNEKYTNLQPFLEQIDSIEESVNTLEKAAYRLDAYSKRLEAKFKSLEKR